MDETQIYQIGRHRIVLALHEGVAPVSPYSLLLAENIPDLMGQSVVDVGSGSGFLAILARLQGAERVYLLDTYDSAIARAADRPTVRASGRAGSPSRCAFRCCPLDPPPCALASVPSPSRPLLAQSRPMQ
jgi:hypothetical protein